MIQFFSILALLLAVGLPAVDYVVLRPRRATLGAPAPMRAVERLIYLLFLLSLALLALSGVVSLAFGTRMHHWLLILHMTFAPLFSICIAALAVLWSRQIQLADIISAGRAEQGDSVVMWLVLAAGFVTILSAILGMMSWFGSEWQIILLNTHRVSAFILLVVAAVQASRLLPRRAIA